MTKVKICGITNYGDADNAANLGADFLGFNFYSKSPRYIDYKSARNIVKKLAGKVKIVGVFVNETVHNIKKTDTFCDLDLIQLSGDETNNFIVNLKKKLNKKIIKCFRIRNSNDIKHVKNFEFDYLMLDSFKECFYGGTGTSFDFDIVENIDKKKLFLSGGMNKDNVKSAIEKLNPFAVDVCSSVEQFHGKKDFEKMKEFIYQIKIR